MQVFDFNDYRTYLGTLFSGSGPTRGMRLKLAEHLQCQASFLTQVFSEKAHLSLEHAIKTTQYLNFDTSESDYFMLLVQKGKSGNRDLENYFEAKIQTIRNDREQINSRIKVQTDLTLEDQMNYYSVWHHSAIHILTSIPGFHSPEKISQKLKLDIITVKNSLKFLVEKGFVKVVNGHYQIGSRRIHLKKGSPMLPRHHSNWRMRAIESVDRENNDDLHYTAVLGIAKSDTKLFRERLLKLLEEFEPMITKSAEDSQVVLLLDWFET